MGIGTHFDVFKIAYLLLVTADRTKLIFLREHRGIFHFILE